MLFSQKAAVALSSFIVRFIGYCFLRWIPFHHGPSIIITALCIYLASIWSTLGLKYSAQASDSSVPRAKGANGAAEPRVTALRSLLTGLPSTTSRAATTITVLLNLVLSALAIDFTLRGTFYSTAELSFSRVGYVSPTSAKILIREPRQEVLPLHFWYQKVMGDNDDAQIDAGELDLLNDATDYTSPFILHDLEPSTQYRYSVSNNLTGEFTTASAPGSETSSHLTFLTSSCIKPNFPYHPLSHPLGIPGVEVLANVVGSFPSIRRPAFMLFLGDFIYIDVPVRFGSSISDYRREYQKVYASPSWKASGANMPWLHTLDDHEIANDWAAGNETAPFPAAEDPYRHYHVSVNPPIPENPYAIPSNVSYFSFTNGPASFFLVDTRTYRSEPSLHDSTILGSAQLQSLLAFISRPEPEGVKWKVITSSVPFTKNWHVGTPDTWGGFLEERRKVLEAIWQAERQLGVRIVLLSGDRHEFAATRFPNPALSSSSELSKSFSGPGRGIHEFCVGPLSQFYLPFRSYEQDDNEDVAVKYVPDGNFKFGSIDIGIEGEGEDRNSVLTYSLYVEGEEVWKYRLSVPLEKKAKDEPSLPGEVLLDTVEVQGPLDQLLGRAKPIVDWVKELVQTGLKTERVDEA